MARKDSTEISRSACRISTKRDMCVPLKLCGRLTYMLKLAMVCCSPAERSLHPHRVADVLDADAVDRQLARVGARLHVLDFREGGAPDLGGGGGWIHDGKPTGKVPKPVIRIVAARERARHPPECGGGALSNRVGAAQAPPAERMRSGDCSAHQRSTLAARPAASRPAAARQLSREPCSMKRSGMPSCSSGSCSPSRGQQLAHRGAGAAVAGVLLDGDEGAVARARARRPAPRRAA